MTVTPLPTPPSSSDPTNFSTRADAFMAALPTFANELNALGIAITTPGMISIPYSFSTTTTDADPGAGNLRFNNATQNLTTVIRADLLAASPLSNADFTAALDTMDDSTSTVKGFIFIYETATPTNFLLFSVSAVAAPSGYRNITVACIGFSAANPFANSDAVTLQFIRNGDKGDTGANGTSSLDFSVSGTGIVTPPATPTANCVGYLGMPKNDQDGAYTLVMADAGKFILKDNGAGSNITIPPNSSVAFPIGTVIHFVTISANINLIRGSGVVLKSGVPGVSKDWNLAEDGTATILKIGTDYWMLNGTGLS